MSRLSCTAAWRTLTYELVSQIPTSPSRQQGRRLTHLQVNLVRLRVRVYLRHHIIRRVQVPSPDEDASYLDQESVYATPDAGKSCPTHDSQGGSTGGRAGCRRGPRRGRPSIASHRRRSRSRRRSLECVSIVRKGDWDEGGGMAGKSKGRRGASRRQVGRPLLPPVPRTYGWRVTE